MDQDQDQNQSRDDRKFGEEQTSPGRGPQLETKRRRQETLNLLDSRKSTSREKPTPRRGPGTPQLEKMRRQEEEIERKYSLPSDEKNKSAVTLTPPKEPVSVSRDRSMNTGLFPRQIVDEINSGHFKQISEPKYVQRKRSHEPPPLKDQESNLGVNVQMDGSLSSPSLSSLPFPTQPPSNQRYVGNYTTNLPVESGMDGSFGFHSHNNTMVRQTNETAWQQGLSPQPWKNPQEFNFGLEQTNKQDHYQSEAFAGVNVQTDGSSSSSLQFPTQPPSNQINYITNLPERSYSFSLKNRTENSASSGNLNLNLNLGYGPSSYPVFGEGSSSAQEKRSSSFNAEDLSLLTRENIERARMSGISEFNSLYAQRGITVLIPPPRRPSPPNQLQGSVFYLFPTLILPGPSPPHQRQILVLNCRNPTYPPPGYRPGPQEPTPSSQAFPQTEGRSDGEGDDESVDLNLKL